MKMHTLRLVLLVMLLCQQVSAAPSIGYNSAPSSAASGANYYVETWASDGGASNLWLDLYKDWNWVDSSYANYSGCTVGTWQADTGPLVIEYYACATSEYEVWYWPYYYPDYEYDYADTYHYVTIGSPVNQAPIGVRDYSTAVVPQYGVLSAAGWAADYEVGAPVVRVDIVIDGNDVGDANLGGYRPDVADAYSRSDYTSSGWSFDYPIGALSVGTHTLQLVAWDNQGASTALMTTPVDFLVTSYTEATPTEMADSDNDGLPDWLETALGSGTDYHGATFNKNAAVVDNLAGKPSGTGSGQTKLTIFYPGK